MSSKFSSPFLKKSPLAAGGYASGVDGMRYVSPKQPPAITEPKETKEPKRKILEDQKTPEGKKPPEVKRRKREYDSFEDDGNPSVRKAEEDRTINRTELGEPVERFLRPEDFKGGAKNPEYIKKKKALDDAIAKGADAKYKDQIFAQDQTRTNEYTTDITGVETLTREGKYVNVGKERRIR